MIHLRETLQRLGWPVDSLSDDDIGRELQRRWFESNGAGAGEIVVTSIAAARGVFHTMAADGNLDALCWSADGEDTEMTLDTDQDILAAWMHPRRTHRPPHLPDRRSSPRQPASDFVEFVCADWDIRATGWLVDVSAEGIAFIADARSAPAIGLSITPTVRRRSGSTTALGAAIVVRREFLDDGLILVCAKLETSWDPIR
jgi:hypothetical protein